MQYLMRFFKGVCMGLADVVPGVSGGTVALVLGIYVAFIEAVKSLNVRWLPKCVKWVFSGFKREHLDAAIDDVRAIHWHVLIPLGLGIVVAVGIGSRIIPGLMEDHPVGMRAFFLGLVLASIVAPFREIRERTPAVALAIAAATVVTFALVGFTSEPPARWSDRAHNADVSLGEFTRINPSVASPVQLYCGGDGEHQNAALREALASANAENAAQLDRICDALDEAGDDVAALAAITAEHHLDDDDYSPFDQSVVPAGTIIQIPQPAFWFVLFAGIIAICAMVLPGISGSFILLMLGVYYTVLISIKGTIDILTGDLAASTDPLIYFSLFSVGALIGITSFVRILSWLFERYHDVTLGVLVGLMIGSLRVLWPWKLGSLHGGPTINIMPGATDNVPLVLAIIVGGFVLVTGLSVIAARIDSRIGEDSSRGLVG